MPINNQTPDPRFQRVLVAARELVKHEVDAQGANVEWSVIASGLQRLRDALADLEGVVVPPTQSGKVRPVLPRKP